MIFPKSVVKTLLHLLELAIIVGIVYGVSLLFDISADSIQLVIGAVLVALAKVARTEPKIGVADWVNGS